MLSAKWIAFFTFVWLGGAFLGAIIEGAYIGEGERSVGGAGLGLLGGGRCCTRLLCGLV